MPSQPDRTTILVASYLEPVHVDAIRALDGRLEVLYEPDLLPPPRYAADHVGGAFSRSEAGEARWRGLLARADVLFDFDRTNLEALPELAPRVRWIQGTSAGIGQLVVRHRLHERMPETVFTTASGVHARPLAEFCALAMLAFSRRLFRMQELQREHRWERFAGTDLEDRTVVIYGHGAIGQAVARVARGFGMRTIGVRRRVEADPGALHADEVHPVERLPEVLPRAEFLVIAAPHTPETEGTFDARALARLPRGAVVINIGRGALVDESALLEALRSGHLGGAALDVFAEEPLPPESPLWDLPNVLVSPHSASTSDRENERLTALFADNLRRFLGGRPLRNVFDPVRLY